MCLSNLWWPNSQLYLLTFSAALRPNCTLLRSGRKLWLTSLGVLPVNGQQYWTPDSKWSFYRIARNQIRSSTPTVDKGENKQVGTKTNRKNTYKQNKTGTYLRRMISMQIFSCYKELILLYIQFISVQFSCLVVSDSLRPHEQQHTRPPYLSPTSGVYPNPCPLSRWCHPTISSSVIPFSSCPQSFPASESSQMSQLFTWDQSIGVSASTSVLPMNTQDQSKCVKKLKSYLNQVEL